MKKGEIEEHGTHDFLLDNNGTYKKLYEIETLKSNEKIEHIGIAVNDLKKANKLYSDILGVNPYKTETVESEKVITSFLNAVTQKLNYCKVLMKQV